MNGTPLAVKRLPIRLDPDPSRTIPRYFCPGDETRVRRLIKRILQIPKPQAEQILGKVVEDFSARHSNATEVLRENYEAASQYVAEDADPSERQKLLIGAYFTMEYAIESAALFNPSMVPARSQKGLPAGSTRFLMSLRATGEGHLSSIVFRRGVIDANCHIVIETASPYSRQLKVVENQEYEKETYFLKLIEMGGYNELAQSVLDSLGERFTFRELGQAIEQSRDRLDAPPTMQVTAHNMLTLARSNYQLHVPEGVDLSEVVIFPYSENESHGIEDLRLVTFTDDDGSKRYYGTYTAYNGHRILPQILEMRDGTTLHVHTMTGRYAQNKGLALFPRKLDGRYMMISRLDGENLYIMESGNVRFWNDAKLLQTPKFPWELVQIGNCGSPLETKEGWLLLTHGVGPMRQYFIGAMLLDLDDPSKVIGQTAEPLLVPTGEERAGYVPNVVYSCGGMIHNGTLVIPYAMSDTSSSFATVPLGALLDLLRG